MKHFYRYFVLVASVGWLVACGAAQSSFNTNVPSGIDLSGNWKVDLEQSDGGINRTESQREFEKASIDGKVSASLGSLYYAEQDFPIVGSERLEIQQDSRSIGILYGPGKYRDLVWGLQSRGEWEIDIGWQGSRLTIESSVSHSRGVETYELDPDGRTMRVTVQIKAGSERRTLRRAFVRVD